MNYAQLYVALQSYTQNYEPDFVSNIPVFVSQAEKRIYNTVQLAYLRKNQIGTLTIGGKYLSAPSDFLSTYSIAVIDSTGKYHYLINKDVNYIREVYPDPALTGLPKYYALFGPTVSSGITTNDLSFIMAPAPVAAYQVELNYYYYPASIVAGIIQTLGAPTGGSGYNNGVYYNVPMLGGAGNGATATIVIATGTVTSCVIENPGSLYRVNDALTAPQEIIGGGTLFSVGVTSINNSTGTSWLGDSYDASLLYGALVEAYGFMKGEADMMAYYEKKFIDALVQLKRLGDGLERGDAYRDGQAKVKVQ